MHLNCAKKFEDLLQGLRNVLPIEGPLKMMIIIFILAWKLFFFLRYLNICPDFFGRAEKRFDKKPEVNLSNYAGS